tara:strand:+ start:127 stop:372 length:246 start_codon:yes stop_codon:yes gene_type:complete
MNRNNEQKKLIILEIIKKINELNLSTEYPSIKTLYELFKEYLDNDYSININIPFPEINRKIIGLLPINLKNKPIIKIINLK